MFRVSNKNKFKKAEKVAFAGLIIFPLLSLAIYTLSLIYVYELLNHIDN
jgi:hypothetical protein